MNELLERALSLLGATLADRDDAAADVAAVLELDPTWLNAGAVALVGERLPPDFEKRLRPRVYGNLVVSVLGRIDLLRLKLWAAADEGPLGVHLRDIQSMKPSTEELTEAIQWVRESSGALSHELDDVLRTLKMEG